MNDVLVSILVPVYNTSKYLVECIESLINQTMKNIEIICINDGSTDSSLKILQEYAQKDSRIIVINKKNTGYGNSMNIGLNKAKGEYIGIVESDDCVTSEMFERLYDTACTNNADVVKSNYYSYKSEECNEVIFTEILDKCKYNECFKPLDEQEIFNVQGSIWSGFYKKEFLLENQIWFNETPGASYQDISFNIKLWTCAKRVFLLKDAYLKYRVDNIHSSVKSPEKVFCVCDEFEEINRFLSNKPKIKNEILNVLMKLKYKIYLGNYYRLSSSFQYAFLLRMSKELNNEYSQGDLNQLNWNEDEWEVLQLIAKNPHQYFKNTAKDYCDNRLSMLPTLNTEIYSAGFFEYINKFENIIIYGAGIIGKKVAQCLINNNKHIFSFAVSNINTDKQVVMSIDVKSIDDLLEMRENSIILVAVKEKDQFDIISNLQTLKFKNIVSIDSLLLKSIC